ncbi:MAG: ABC transporter ATP-binding protein [Alphaproteobacteria bacterium]|nr:ABC transporter ATP-binding protein [Alphaproteobacteria bacterium]
MTALSVRDLTLALDGRDVLKGIGFDAAPGELIGVIGPNGAGKTTLLRALAGAIPHRAGNITLDGAPVTALAARERARRIAYLGQEEAPQWAISCENLVGLGRLPHRPSWQGESAADRAAVAAALMACDALQLADRPVNRLSGGERTRVLLARALAVESDFLLADEPTAGLDPAHALQVMEVLACRAAAGTGVIVTLHDLTNALRYCNRLILLNHGTLAAEGSPDAVLSPENLARIYGIRAHAGTAAGKPFLVPLMRTGDEDAAKGSRP